MRNEKPSPHTLQIKQKAVRLMESGQRIAAAARSRGVLEQTISKYDKAHRAGTLKAVVH